MLKNNSPICVCNNIGKSYENFEVLKNINFSVHKGEKVGLVGANGAGKSTLLKIISGIINCDVGKVLITKNIKVAYIPQDFSGSYNEFVSDFIQLVSKGLMETNSSRLFSTLSQLNLNSNILERKIKDLSGGEKTKIALLRILISDADFYLLDEPTNNLDASALGLLESFVINSNKTFLIVSHDREFLDRIVQNIIEIDENTRESRIFNGNFTTYMTERKHLTEIKWQDYLNKTKKVRQLEQEYKDKKRWMESIDKKRVNNKNLPIHEKEKPKAADLRDLAGKAGHRLKVVKNKIERFNEKNEDIEKPKEPLRLKINFDFEKRSGDKVFELKSVVKKMEEGSLGPIDLNIFYGDRVLITGVNGVGKSTLIKMIIGLVLPDKGEIITGSNVEIGYLPQQEDFIKTHTAIDEFLRYVKIEEGIGRRLLNRFRLTENDVNKKVSELSSGEYSRLVLAIIMSKKVNCLILDEPSNHLDLEVLESFESALKEYKGTLIVVSHDRYFVRHVGFTKLLLLKGGKLL